MCVCVCLRTCMANSMHDHGVHLQQLHYLQYYAGDGLCGPVVSSECGDNLPWLPQLTYHKKCYTNRLCNLYNTSHIPHHSHVHSQSVVKTAKVTYILYNPIVYCLLRYQFYCITLRLLFSDCTWQCLVLSISGTATDLFLHQQVV